eukprot:COSAG03_NODE_1976_length_3271_cov_4.343523_1_plen_68_part_10
MDDLTLIDDERDLIEMGFSLSYERELLLRALAELKAAPKEIRLRIRETGATHTHTHTERHKDAQKTQR